MIYARHSKPRHVTTEFHQLGRRLRALEQRAAAIDVPATSSTPNGAPTTEYPRTSIVHKIDYEITWTGDDPQEHATTIATPPQAYVVESISLSVPGDGNGSYPGDIMNFSIISTQPRYSWYSPGTVLPGGLQLARWYWHDEEPEWTVTLPYAVNTVDGDALELRFRWRSIYMTGSPWSWYGLLVVDYVLIDAPIVWHGEDAIP